MRTWGGSSAWRVLALALCAAAVTRSPVAAQDAAPPETRAGQIAARQAEKARASVPYRPPGVERLIQGIDEHLTAQFVKWHAFFGHAYSGAGPALGAGYMFHPGDYDTFDLRAAMSVSRSKRIEAEYRKPRLFGRRGVITAQAGWRDGVDQPFYGVGTAPTSADDRVEFDFRRTHGSIDLDVRPRRRALLLGAALEVSHYDQRRAPGSAFDRRYPAGTLPGVGATVNFVDAVGRVALDWRPESGYAQRGGAYGVTARRALDVDGLYSFTQFDYDVVQHIPLLRDAWVLSLHGRAETTYTADGDEVPFFRLPTLGNSTTLRGFANQRFHDRNSVLLSAEWRVLVNRFLDAAFFYDAGKVTARPQQLDLRGLKSDYGIGLRLHTLAATPLRIDVARSNETWRLVFGSVAVF